MMKTTLVTVLAALGALAALSTQHSREAAASAPHSPARTWHLFARPAGAPSFIFPASLATDAHGQLYVADVALDQIQKLSPSGRQLDVIGSYGWRPGHFESPSRVGVDQWGNIYVLDIGNHRIQLLSPAGRPRTSFGLGPNSYPDAMAVDRWGDIYLASYTGIQKRSPHGALLAFWPRRGGSSLAVDGAGNLYYLAYGQDQASGQYSHFIYELSPQGETVAKWRYTHTGYPQSLAVSLSGQVYVLDPNGWRINLISSTGKVTSQISLPISRQYGPPPTFTVDAAGNLYLANPSSHQVIKLSPAGDLLAVWGMRVSTPGTFRLPAGVATDAHGNVYVADSWNDRVREISASGAPIRQWGWSGSGPGRFNLPSDVLVDRQGNVVVADYGNSRLEVFSPRGRFLRSVHVPGQHYVYRYGPYFPYFGPASMRIALDAHGNYLVVDTTYNRVIQISPTGRLLRGYSQWVTRRESVAGGAAVDTAGNIYISDAGASHIVKLSPSGARLAVWGQFGYVGLGNFNRPAAIALDAVGDIYVSDVGNHRIQELSPSGRPMRAWGILGAAPGQFAYPQGIAVGPNGTVYVADTWNNRIQTLRPNTV